MVQSAACFELIIACITYLESHSMMTLGIFLLAAISAAIASPTFGFVLLMKSVCMKIIFP